MIVRLKSTTQKQKHAVTVIIGSGQERSADGSEKSASFIQVHRICTYEKSLFVTDVAASTIKLVKGLSQTVLLLKTLRCLYAFDISISHDQLVNKIIIVNVVQCGSSFSPTMRIKKQWSQISPRSQNSFCIFCCHKKLDLVVGVCETFTQTHVLVLMRASMPILCSLRAMLHLLRVGIDCSLIPEHVPIQS